MARHHGIEPKKQGNGLTILANMLLGSVLTCIIGLFIYLWGPFHKDEKKTTTQTPVIVPKNQEEKPAFEFHDLLPRQEIQALPDSATFSKDPQKNTTPPKEAITADPPETVTTTADDEIKATEPAVAHKDDKPQPTANPTHQMTEDKPAHVENVTPKITYVIRMAVFDNEPQALELLEQVNQLGIKAKIIQGQYEGTTTYQVVSRRMIHRESVENAQLKLQRHGINSLIFEEINP